MYNAYSIYFWMSGLCPIWLAGGTISLFPKTKTFNVYDGPNSALSFINKFYLEKFLRQSTL